MGDLRKGCFAAKARAARNRGLEWDLRKKIEALPLQLRLR